MSFTSPLHPFSVRLTVLQGHSGIRHIRSRRLLKSLHGNCDEYCHGVVASRVAESTLGMRHFEGPKPTYLQYLAEIAMIIAFLQEIGRKDCRDEV